MTFTGTDSCGNSPKNVFVARFEENLFTGDRDALAEVVAEDCVLQIVSEDGLDTYTGREEVVEALLGVVERRPEAGHLEAAITHGKAAAAWGHWKDDAASENLRFFSHTFWFQTHKAEAFAQIRVFGP
ncbi:nuclear transport factor 2 family protein [Brevibacterium sp. GP-SGM9]|uniref:nuclear transport factor 2 family protein n=1 Tax=unclassified Brevibacterium TaxID=2614124 RepID=UPI001E5A1B52|nr:MULTISPECIES: nuclear transport factor 2 family protein [unclassified Brevibacterium]MCD1285399.1 hypothetical protein [Brevibacterium sp. CCUG 69071]MDK8434449.1 nuclear transport factor 2 family protein [Brevibacterium sp. H-BE7]